MTGKSCKRKDKVKLDVPISKSGTENKFLKTSKKNPFTGDFF